LAFSEIVGKLETIEDILKGKNMPVSLRWKLLAMERQDYVIDKVEADRVVFKRLVRDGFYWLRCDCGSIVEVPLGKSSAEYCLICNQQEGDDGRSRMTTIYILLLFLPVVIGGLWLLFSFIGILPTLLWPLTIVPLSFIMAPGLGLIIAFQVDQYKLKKKRRKLRDRTREVI
jgi:hypothetical protein